MSDRTRFHSLSDIPAAALANFLQHLADAQRDRNGCLIWPGDLDRYGYGRMRFRTHDGRSAVTGAHRMAVIVASAEPLPVGLVVDHICGNRSCVESTHLRLLTNAENIKRGLTATKRDCVNGHPLHGDNLHVWTDRRGYTRRICKACRRDNKMRFQRRRTA